MNNDTPDLFGQPPPTGVGSGQGMLFGAEFYRDSIGMAPNEATTLLAAGLLSFDPNKRQSLTEAHVMELDFAWAMYKSGCPMSFLERLLSGLPKPYAYRISEMHLDWRTLIWSRLPTPDETIAKWVADKLGSGDREELLRLAGVVQEALEKLGLPSEPASES